MSYIEKMCFVNWRFRSFVQYIYHESKIIRFLCVFFLLDIRKRNKGSHGKSKTQK